jgi:DNA-binding MarR family transcriptional regulator
MADFKAAVNPLFLREDELHAGMEMLFLAWRDIAAAGDAILEAHQLGRAHYRALYFVGRQPGITVGDLLALLGITKQSLSRVLRQMVESGYIEQKPGLRDRRQRHLTLTDGGKVLEAKITALSRDRFATAYRQCGAAAVQGFRSVLAELRTPHSKLADILPPPGYDATDG